MNSTNIDIHCHSSMRAFHSHENNHRKNLWDENYNEEINNSVARFVIKRTKGVAKCSQSSLYQCIKGNTRIIFDSLYPIERGFIDFKWFPKKLLSKKIARTLVVVSAGINSKQYLKYTHGNNYFTELLEQYNFLVDGQGKSPCGKYEASIAKNYQDLEECFLNPNKIAIIITIEGAHVLGTGMKSDLKKDPVDLEKQVINNISKIKAWQYPPFFITFAHHFYNQLCGHSSTLPPASKLTCDQNFGLNTGFTDLGWKALKALLSHENGKRILIDTRHMSVQARKEYYEFVCQHNKNNPHDLIPIISSHSAMNGFDKMTHSTLKRDTIRKKKKTAFCNWSLNVSAEEALYIYQSKGLLGLILDKGRHSGINLLRKIDNHSHLGAKKRMFLKLILDNIFTFIAAVKEKEAWDCLCLGTDFDGVITHFDQYPNMASIPELKRDLINHLKDNQYYKHLWYGYTPEELMEKIFSTNSQAFLKRNFN